MKHDLMAPEMKISPDAHPVAHEINRRMRSKGFRSPKALSLKAGLGGTYVRDVFQGRSKNPRTKELQAIATALECAVEDLLQASVPENISAETQEFADPTKVEPLDPLVVGLIKLWEELSWEGRTRLFMRATELVTEQRKCGR